MAKTDGTAILRSEMRPPRGEKHFELHDFAESQGSPVKLYGLVLTAHGWLWLCRFNPCLWLSNFVKSQEGPVAVEDRRPRENCEKGYPNAFSFHLEHPDVFLPTKLSVPLGRDQSFWSSVSFAGARELSRRFVQEVSWNCERPWKIANIQETPSPRKLWWKKQPERFPVPPSPWAFFA